MNQPPLRVLIATPCAQSVVTLQYFLSFIATFDAVMKSNRDPSKRQIDLGLYTLGQESLISRGRDHCAAIALYQKWDQLFFIDADQGWTFEQFEKIARSEKTIIGGVTPIKTLPINLNYLPKEDDAFYHKDRMRSVASLDAMWKGHGSDEIQVGYIGTGFLKIDVAKVLLPLTQYAEPFKYPNPATGKLCQHWQFFRTQPINGLSQSEDWGFLNFARQHGIEPYINASVRVTHTGNFTFDSRMEQPINPDVLHQSQQREVGGSRDTLANS